MRGRWGGIKEGLLIALKLLVIFMEYLGKVASFSKSDRFKVLEKEPLKTSHI